MTYQDKIKQIIDQLSDSREFNQNLEEFLSAEHKLISYLFRNNYIESFDISPRALIINPGSAGPVALAKYLSDHYQITFTRELQGTLYQWVSVIDTYTLPIVIMANEYGDLGGTVVELY